MKYDIRSITKGSVKLAPSLLAADFGCLDSEIKRMSDAGIDILHLDVMDGHLVPNISFGVPVISALRDKHDMLFDAHLMISHPLEYAEAFAKAGADHITFHVECEDDIAKTIEKIRSLDCTVGLSVNPQTPLSTIEPYLDKIDLILIMTVQAGFGGQSFKHEVVPKIAEARKLIDDANLNIKLEVDGGINNDTASLVTQAGGELMVAGTALFRSRDLNQSIKTMIG